MCLNTPCCKVQAAFTSTGASFPDPLSPPSVLARVSIVRLGTFHGNLQLPLTSTKPRTLYSLDPSIRVTYHPRVKKVSQSGFYTKISNHVYSQHITVYNTKTTPVEDVRIVDQVPVSEDEQIKVKLVNPVLTMGSLLGGGEGGSKEKEKPAQKVGIAKGIVAQWDGTDEPRAEEDAKSLGKNGKINWLCSIPAQGKVNLVLQWEILAPVNADVVGL